MAVSYTRLSEDLGSHDLVQQAPLAGNYAGLRLPEIPVERILDHAEYWKWEMQMGMVIVIVVYASSDKNFLQKNLPVGM